MLDLLQMVQEVTDLRWWMLTGPPKRVLWIRCAAVSKTGVIDSKSLFLNLNLR